MTGLSSIRSDARFHFAVGKGNVVHSEFEVADTVFFDEERFLFKAEQAA